MLLEDLAKELVDVTSELIGGRTVNIMNTKGIIIASTETERIGSFHQGALEAVLTGKPVNIQKDQLFRYQGAREGCNMPLRVNGSIIGAVGIYGDPEEIRYLAHLLEGYATKYFQLEAMVSPRLADWELRGRILRHLLSPTDSSMTAAASLMQAQNIRMSLPVTVAVVSTRSGAPMTFDQGRFLPTFLEQFLEPRQDVWGIVNDRLVILLSHREASLSASLSQALSEDGSMAGYRLCISSPRSTLWDIQHGYEQASILDAASPEPFNDIRQLPSRCLYMLSHTAATECGFLEDLCRKARSSFSPQELEVLLRTAQCYYESGRKVNQASAQLFVHKNTLQYRVRRLLEALDLNHCSDFQQEYLIRLLIEHCKRNQSLRAWK